MATPNGYQLEQYLIEHYLIVSRIGNLRRNISDAEARMRDIEATIRITPDYAQTGAHSNLVSDPVATAFVHAVQEKDRLTANISLWGEQIVTLEQGISDMADCIASLGTTDQYIVRARYTTDRHTRKVTPCWKVGDMLGEEFGEDAARDESTIRRDITQSILPAIVDYLAMFCPDILCRICAVAPPVRRTINTRYSPALSADIAV